MRGPNKRMISSIAIICLIAMIFSGIKLTAEIEAAEKEFRGVWVSTIWGLDYPSKTTTDEETLKRDAIKILDNIKAMGFNAVFLQVRSCSDAIYKSEIYPWSKYLTGAQGLAPKNNFDPLQYFIEEAHKRDLELHAWINPYRITAVTTDNNNLHESNPAVLYPELTVIHTDGKLYFNPGEPKARSLIIDGIKEIIDNYEVDGIHLDDYFYPDRDFDDDDTYAKYENDYKDKDEWRRNNNNILIKEIKETVYNKSKDMKFGVSPAGIWANKTTNKLGSDTRGRETYNNEFADSRYWVKQGYVDYIIPQIYWNIGYEVADYSKLVKWWSDTVKGTNVKLYIGQAAYRTVDADKTSQWYGTTEIKKQIELNRTNDNVKGYTMFAYNSFIKNNELYKMIGKINEEYDNTDNKIENDYKHYILKHNKTEENDNYLVMRNIEEEKIVPLSIYKAGEMIGLSKMDGKFDVIYNEKSFIDTENHSDEDNIKFMAARDIINGVSDKEFSPEKNIKRADFVLMLMRMLEISNMKDAEGFSDVPKDIYYYDALATAKKLNFIKGSGQNKYNPESDITRQDIFVITYRALDILNMVDKEVDMSYIDRYDDKDKISEYSREAVAYFTKNNIFEQEMSERQIAPMKIANRAETATFLANVIKSYITK